MPDIGHERTDKELEALEKRIAEVYKEASNEVKATITEYFDSLKKRDAEMKRLLDAGEITLEHYKQWRLNQIGRGERFIALRDKLANRFTDAYEVAISYVNDTTPTIYSLNRNYAAYTIEQSNPNADFNLFNERTVKRLIVQAPDVMPNYPKAKAIRRGIDLDYGKKQITAVVTSSILQGHSIDRMALELRRRIVTMSLTSAIRAARTATTQAQNAGRQDTYNAAAKMGIKTRKMWVATLDGRTRHDHRRLDGQIVEYDKPFEYDGYKLMTPADGSLGAPAHTIYNCRCTMNYVDELWGKIDPGKRRAIDPETGESVLVPWMTYDEWERQKTVNMLRQTLDNSHGHVPKSIDGNYDDFEPLNLSDVEKDALLRLRELSDRDNVEYGIAIAQDGTVSEPFTSGRYASVKIPEELRTEGCTLLHSHTDVTPLSALDLQQLLDKNVYKVGNIAYNNDVFIASAGDGYIPTTNEYERFVESLANEVRLDLTNDPSFYEWDFDEKHYMAVREQAYRITREHGWTLEGGRLNG